MKKIILILFLSLTAGLLQSRASVLCDSTETTAPSERKLKLPVIGIGVGLLNFSGDVGYSKINEPLAARTGYHFEIQYPAETRLSVSANLLYGHALGEDKSVLRTLNFKTTILSEGLTGRFEFIRKKGRTQILIPYITAGVEYMSFVSKGDLKDANGNTYYYWKDGTVRNLDETDPAASTAIKLHRDYNYETDLRVANLDGFGNYKTSAVSVPVGIGARLRLSGRCSVNLSVVAHMVQSDLVDGISSASAGDRKGNSKNDNIIYSSAGFRYSLSAPRDVPKQGSNGIKVKKADVEHVDFEALARDDSDGDGIPDVDDVSPNTPTGITVDTQGRPMDGDHDGVPDYRDKEPQSASDAVTNEDGVTLTDAMIQEKYERDSLNALPRVIEYIKSYDREAQQSPTVAKSATFPKGEPMDVKDVPEKYIRLDKDKNNVIAPEEISSAIDDYLNGKSPYSVTEFYELIDFFFIKK